jgi:hypothetical protein
MRRWLPLLLALVACHPAPAAAPPPPPPPAMAPDAGIPLYQGGQPYTPSRAGDDRFTCHASDDEVAACRALRPDARCDPQPPVGYWEGEPRCQGTRPTEEQEQAERDRLDGLAVPTCVCSCTDEYARAADALDARREACSRVP